jgi:Profilin
LSGPEVATICHGFDNNDGVYGSGIKIGGEKYFTIRADDKVIQGRKVGANEVRTNDRERKVLYAPGLNKLFSWRIIQLANKLAKSPKSCSH